MYVSYINSITYFMGEDATLQWNVRDGEESHKVRYVIKYIIIVIVLLK